MSLYGTLTPAYGRDYKTGADAVAAWNDGKDFKINNPEMRGVYCSVRDTAKEPAGHKMQIRWNKLQCVDVITRQADGTYAGSPPEDLEDQSYE
jgi:hypothetical protein